MRHIHPSPAAWSEWLRGGVSASFFISCFPGKAQRQPPAFRVFSRAAATVTVRASTSWLAEPSTTTNEQTNIMKINDLMNVQNGISSVPSYQKWYSSPKMAPAVRGRAMMLAAAPEPEPEPKPWHVVWDKSFSDSYYKGAPSGSGITPVCREVFFCSTHLYQMVTPEDPNPEPRNAGSDLQHDSYCG